jgi:hypothetical protein
MQAQGMQTEHFHICVHDGVLPGCLQTQGLRSIKYIRGLQSYRVTSFHVL